MFNVNRLSMIGAAVLCVAVGVIHVQDQGGVTVLTDPAWLGWAYRLLEVGSLVTAGALVYASGARSADVRATLTWAVAGLVGAGPFVGYVLSRTTGLPQSSDDIGNWGEPLGIASLIVEGALVLLAVAGLVRLRAVSVERVGTPVPAPVH